MHNDDGQVGRLLSRREILQLLGISGAAVTLDPGWPLMAAGRSPLPACIVRPEQTEGPYFVDERLERSDVRADPSNGVVKAGALLDVSFVVSRMTAGGCTPLANAQVDLWQCDALGVYSDVNDAQFKTTGQKFLRGHQFTDAAGRVTFTTIYPGWYRGRTVHIHFKIRTAAAAGRRYEFTSQMYFDDSVSDRVFAQTAYARKETGRVLNSQDGIYRQQGGTQLMARVTETKNKLTAPFEIGLQF
jgi:protocatechuate 3,4-dioxygenase beta subunit